MQRKVKKKDKKAGQKEGNGKCEQTLWAPLRGAASLAGYNRLGEWRERGETTQRDLHPPVVVSEFNGGA